MLILMFPPEKKGYTFKDAKKQEVGRKQSYLPVQNATKYDVSFCTAFTKRIAFAGA